MAERRMFAKTIIDSDAFLDMPLSSQVLYFHLGMRADDDGFVNNPKKIQRMIGASDDDLRLLAVKKFIIPFETGVVVIKHWKIHNYIQKDRHKDTHYQEELALLETEDNGTYTILSNENSIDVSKMDTECIQDVSKMDTQVRLGKDSREQESIEKEKKNINEHFVMPNVNDFFEEIWKLYPKKKGKGQVSRSKKITLLDLGYDHIARCINRYVTEFKASGKDEQYMMYGSTFFNSGYVDYLDENYGESTANPEEDVELMLDDYERQ